MSIEDKQADTMALYEQVKDLKPNHPDYEVVDELIEEWSSIYDDGKVPIQVLEDRLNEIEEILKNVAAEK